MLLLKLLMALQLIPGNNNMVANHVPPQMFNVVPEVSLKSRKISAGERLMAEVRVRNVSSQPVFVFTGMAQGLNVICRVFTEDGKEVPDDDLLLRISIGYSEESFLKLPPGMFLGKEVTLRGTERLKPGRYLVTLAFAGYGKSEAAKYGIQLGSVQFTLAAFLVDVVSLVHKSLPSG